MPFSTPLPRSLRPPVCRSTQAAAAHAAMVNPNTDASQAETLCSQNGRYLPNPHPYSVGLTPVEAACRRFVVTRPGISDVALADYCNRLDAPNWRKWPGSIGRLDGEVRGVPQGRAGKVQE